MSNPLISIRSGHITARTDTQSGMAVSRTAQMVIDRYVEILDERRPFFSVEEIKFLVRHLWRPFPNKESILYMWIPVQQAAEAVQPDMQTLVERLRVYDYAQLVAVADAIERYRIRSGNPEVADVSRLREVGLVK